MTVVDQTSEASEKIAETKQLIAPSLRFPINSLQLRNRCSKPSSCKFEAASALTVAIRTIPAAREEPHLSLQSWSGGKRDPGEPLMLNVLVRPQPAAVAAVSALAATVGKTSSEPGSKDRCWQQTSDAGSVRKASDLHLPLAPSVRQR
jgi:hypothetical protein